MSSSARPTQADVARAAGVTQATVSLALKRHPRIPESTRKRILNAANEIGYIPDPMMSALAAYSKRQRNAGFQGTIAFIVNTRSAKSKPSKSNRTYRKYPRENYNWSDIPAFRDFETGARQRANEHGYKLETFDLAQPSMTARRLAGVLRSRNVPGVLLCPQPGGPAHVEIPWDDFSAVAFGFPWVKPALHTVVATQLRATLQTMQQLFARGYQKIGFAFSEIHDNRADHNYLAGYLAARFLAGQSIDSRLIPYRDYSLEQLPQWLERNRPDAIITGDYGILEELKKHGLRAPRDLGVACPLVPTLDSKLAGVYEDSIHIGEAAVDLLVALIQRGERGVPRTPHRLLVECPWVEGSSLKALPPEADMPPCFL